LSDPSYIFDQFELDSRRFQLRRNGQTLKVERIPLELLVFLVSRRGDLVSRQEIADRLWGEGVFVDTDQGINTAIRKIRTALREDSEKPRYIQTISGKGYRFVAEVVSTNGESVAPKVGPVESREAAKTVVTPLTSRGRALYWFSGAGGLVVFAVLSLIFTLGGVRKRVFKPKVGPIHTIAILPLANLSGDASQDYYAEGMTDELITALARNRSLRVISRTSIMQYKGLNKPLRDIASELRVDGILEGSVSRSGNNVHVNLQLIYAPTDTHVWAQGYNRDLSSAMSLPDELTRTIATEVNVDSSAVTPRHSISPEAHDAYLHGLYFLGADSPGRSEEYFQKAIDLQPDYAAAWSGLAASYSMQAMFGMSPLKEIAAKTDAAAHKAVELDDSSAEAHIILGANYFSNHWDWGHADEEFLRAIELDPNNAKARTARAFLLLATNRLEEGLQEEKRASDLEPFAQQPWTLGWVYILSRHCDAAIDDLRVRAETDPQNKLVHMVLSAAYDCKGMEKEAGIENINGIRLESGEKAAAEARRAFEKGGRKGILRWELNEYFKARARKQYVSPYLKAEICGLLRRKEEALDDLEAAYAEHSPELVFLQNLSSFDFLHSDPRYRALVKKISLPPAD
jgi:TolB-like protein/DNA-binding winged helix-turn-helix (wHTH) protein